LLKFDIKNRFKIDNKGDSSKSNDEAKDPENSLKTEMIASILKNGSKTNNEHNPVTFVDLDSIPVEQKQESSVTEKTKIVIEKPQVKIVEEKSIPPKVEIPKIEQIVEKLPPEIKTVSSETTKITQLLKAIEQSPEKMIVPYVDMNQGLITYPILDQIGEDSTNLDLLEKLSSDSIDVLEKITYERLSVCPEHPESLSVTIRLLCPKCNSMDITKLHLIEHKRCGYISENTHFETAPNGTITKCPSCKKEIKNMKTEIATPAMWYTCNGCKEKFDDVSHKLHCRKYNHDFDINKSHTISIPSYRLKNLADTSNSSISPILSQLKSLLVSYGFSADENYTVTGKSGNSHHINIHGADGHQRTVFIFIKNPNAENDNSELNSKIIEVLDTTPTVAILIGFPSISEKAKSITSSYNISLVTEQDPQEILRSIDRVLSDKVPKLES
jgi:hypothetical protein